MRIFKIHQQPHSKQQLKVQQPLPLLPPGHYQGEGLGPPSIQHQEANKGSSACEAVGSTLPWWEGSQGPDEARFL